ncbi:hypothetical protein PsorP6_004671 [Peronosclerospora sorghi]|uniref:Uncharacterized protein n=1 Tax=Peronosclerospora sorghi TaxID=230839 RepID=A0ACC0VQP6_9STRA|nr:hypothetical protein PsorP6_004671 [Peronosclerospora sorghi]
MSAYHGEIATDDEPHESTADEGEEDEDEEDDEMDSEEDKAGLSDSASMLRMMQNLSDDEARRHEQFRRSHFERGAVKRCMAQAIYECSATDKRAPVVTNVMAIVMAGMTKVFVGDITAEGTLKSNVNGMEMNTYSFTSYVYYNQRGGSWRKMVRQGPFARVIFVKRIVSTTGADNQREVAPCGVFFRDKGDVACSQYFCYKSINLS